MEKTLKKKIRYFFSSRYRDREEVHTVLSQLAEMGELALIGGMLRDLALFGNGGFYSDLDFVINTNDLSSFEKRMLLIGAKRNRFGGYSLPPNKWQIDIWPLEKTWAHTAGHVTVNNFSDLSKATFFSCDSIVYIFSDEKIICSPNYFKNLDNRVIDLNLKPNPNPVGNAVRAFRYSLMKEFSWGHALTNFIAETIDSVGWDTLSSYEKQSFNSCYMNFIDETAFMRGLQDYATFSKDDSTFNPTHYHRHKEPQLPLTHHSAS